MVVEPLGGPNSPLPPRYMAGWGDEQVTRAAATESHTDVAHTPFNGLFGRWRGAAPDVRERFAEVMADKSEEEEDKQSARKHKWRDSGLLE
jgi:hypothetical protein